jgi:Domain of unknown function (DUF4292)
MGTYWRYAVFGLCGALLLLAGCRGVSSTSPDLFSSGSLSTAEPFWQRLAERRQAFENLKGLAQARFYAPRQNLAVDSAVVVLQGFEAMRLEGIGSLGQPLFLLITAEKHFSYYSPQEARLVSGSASASNMERVFGITLAPQAFHFMLIGDIPLETLPMGGQVVYLPKSDLYRWEGEVLQPPGYYRVWFAAAHRQPVRFEVEDLLGRVMLRVKYENFRQLQAFTLPYHITVEQPLVDQQVIWRYSEVRLNAGVAPGLFHMRVPAGIERVELN